MYIERTQSDLGKMHEILSLLPLAAEKGFPCDENEVYEMTSIELDLMLKGLNYVLYGIDTSCPNKQLH